MEELGTAADVEVAITRDIADIDKVVGERDERDVVVAGGDGSLHALVQVLHRRDELGALTLGLIPLGTGNDFARGVKLPLDPVAAARVVTAGRTERIDLLVDDTDGVVVNAVHAGAGAAAATEAKPLKQRLGKLGYVAGAVIAGFKVQGDRVQVLADGRMLADGQRRVLQVGIGNGPYIGGGTALTPDADPTDGEVDVMVSFSVNRKDRLRYAIHLRRGTHEERHDVQIVRARTVEIQGHPFQCNADGEVSGPVLHRRWEVRPQALAVRLPTADQAEVTG